MPSRSRVTYTGRDYGSYQRQRQEELERCGLHNEPDDRLIDAEHDLQADLQAERYGNTPPLPLPAASSQARLFELHTIKTTAPDADTSEAA